MTVVLTYQGTSSHRQEAEAKLRQSLPGVSITPRTSTTLVADLAPERAQQVADKRDWQVTEPIYAEIRKPGYNLGKLRAKLAERK